MFIIKISVCIRFLVGSCKLPIMNNPNIYTTIGAIEVSVATMAKEERLQTGEVYTVGFVPSYDLPDGQPNSIDPFLEPLVRDIEAGFIEGM